MRKVTVFSVLGIFLLIATPVAHGISIHPTREYIAYLDTIRRISFFALFPTVIIGNMIIHFLVLKRMSIQLLNIQKVLYSLLSTGLAFFIYWNSYMISMPAPVLGSESSLFFTPEATLAIDILIIIFITSLPFGVYLIIHYFIVKYLLRIKKSPGRISFKLSLITLPHIGIILLFLINFLYQFIFPFIGKKY